MFRLLWTLPICLMLHDARDKLPSIATTIGDTAVKSAPIEKVTKSESQRLAEAVAEQVAGFAPPAGFPSGYAWDSVHKLGQSKIGKEDLFSLKHILDYQPTLFLQMCLDRYDREIHGYRVTFHKQELVNGKLLNPETIKVAFREKSADKPFSVFFDWQEGATKAQRVIYVEGENEDKMQVRPSKNHPIPFAYLTLWSKETKGPEATETSRFTIKDFGIKIGTLRTLKAMRLADERGKLHVEYKGIYEVPELNDRKCFKFIRNRYDPLEEPEKILSELIIYIDTEYWLQTGSILLDADGKLIAKYFFRDLQLNPTYPEDQFSKKRL